MVLFFLFQRIYYILEQNRMRMKNGGGGVVGIVFTIVLFYDHLIEIVS